MCAGEQWHAAKARHRQVDNGALPHQTEGAQHLLAWQVDDGPNFGPIHLHTPHPDPLPELEGAAASIQFTMRSGVIGNSSMLTPSGRNADDTHRRQVM